MQRNLFTLAVGLLLLLICGLLLFVFQVRLSEVAVVTTFGRPTRPITEAGPYLKWPWPIQKVYKFDERIQNFEDVPYESQTKDSFMVLTSVYVGWRINDPAAFFPKFAGTVNAIAEAERKLQERLRNVKVAIVGKHDLSDFVSPSENATNMPWIEHEMLEAIRTQISTNNWGLEIKFLGIKKLQLPENVSKSVLDRMQAERKVLADAYQSEGEREAATIKAVADRDAAVMLSEAESQATQIRAKGEAAAAETLSVFRQDPELAKFILQLDALKEALKDRTTLILDAHTPPFNLLQGVSTNLSK